MSERSTHFYVLPGLIIATQVICSTGSIRRPTQGEDDHIDSSANRAENGVVRIYDAVRVFQQVLSVLCRLSAQTRVDIDRYLPTRTLSDRSGITVEAGPLWDLRAFSVSSREFVVHTWITSTPVSVDGERKRTRQA